MIATCSCGVIVDGGPAPMIARDPSEAPAVVWSEYAGLVSQMVLHIQSSHPEAAPDQSLMWCLGVECARHFVSSDDRFADLRTANHKGLTDRLATAPAPLLGAGVMRPSALVAG